MVADPQVEWLRARMERLVLSANERGQGADRFAELLGIFLANAPDFIMLVATDGTVLSLNRARPGRSVSEVAGHNLFEYFPGEPNGSVRAAVDRVVATGQTVSVDTRAAFTDGTTPDLLLRFAPVESEGRVVALAVIATDVTAQKRAEAALRESEEKLRIAVAATGMGLWGWDVAEDRVVWDDAMCRIWGVTPDTVPRTKQAYLELIHPEDRPRVLAVLSSVFQNGEYPDFEHRIGRPDGSVRRIMAKGAVVRAPDQTIVRLIGGCLDVTEQREIEERARQTQKLEAIGQLSAGIAHNFNNMLMAILPNVELALDAVPAEVVPVLQSARDAGLRAAELVRQLLTFAGRARPTEKRVDDVVTLVERTVAMCRRAFDPRIELTLRLSEHAEPVLSDATQLEQVLLNLLINARDAVMDARTQTKRVSVEVERLAGQVPGASKLGLDVGRSYVCVRVIDNGIGMDAATQLRIYEPFFTTKDIGRGTGLGLSTARAIVREHGGLLDDVSVPGGGTTFFLYLPLSNVAAAPRKASAPPVASRASETIVVVDDEAAVREVTRKMLERTGYTVRTARNGTEAIELLSDPVLRDEVALVLLDMSMPGMSGDAVRRALHELAPGLKIAYFSGHAMDITADVAGVIEKPVTYEGLVRKVREILDPA